MCRTRKLLPALIAALALPLGPLTAQEASTELSADAHDMVATLRKLRVRGFVPSEDERRVFERHAATELPFLVSVLRERSVPGLDDDDASQRLSRIQRDFLLECLAQAPDRALLAALEALQPLAATELDARRAYVQVYGAIGSAPHWKRIFELARVPGQPARATADEPELDPDMEDAVRAAMASLLRRRGDFEKLSRVAGTLPVSLLRPLVHAVGDAADGRGLAFLGEVLGWTTELAPLAVAQIRKVGPSPDAEVTERVAEELRRIAAVDSSDARHRESAVLALGGLHDLMSVPLLVELLESNSEGFRRSVHWSLTRITGLRTSADPQVWRRWLVAEEEWLRIRKLLAFQRLEARHPGEVAAAMAEIARHPLAALEFRDALIALTESPFPPVRTLAKRHLEELPAALLVTERPSPTLALAQPASR